VCVDTATVTVNCNYEVKCPVFIYRNIYIYIYLPSMWSSGQNQPREYN
jgi:hypothetical protein